jgi:hypothetical protein
MIKLTSSAFFADLFDLPWHLVKRQSNATAPVATGSSRLSDSGDGFTPSSAETSLCLDEVIEIDLSTKDLQLFFDFMQLTARFHSLVRHHGLAVDFEQARILLPLIDQYDCEVMRSFLKSKLASLALFNPWELLHLACDHDDLKLGRTAIAYIVPRRLYDFVGSDRSTDGWISLSKLSPAWQSEFLRLLMPGPRTHNTVLLMELDPECRVWAEKFSPKTHQDVVDGCGKRKRA